MDAITSLLGGFDISSLLSSLISIISSIISMFGW